MKKIFALAMLLLWLCPTVLFAVKIEKEREWAYLWLTYEESDTFANIFEKYKINLSKNKKKAPLSFETLKPDLKKDFPDLYKSIVKLEKQSYTYTGKLVNELNDDDKSGRFAWVYQKTKK